MKLKDLLKVIDYAEIIIINYLDEQEYYGVNNSKYGREEYSSMLDCYKDNEVRSIRMHIVKNAIEIYLGADE